jgi:hypothetical protein
MPYVNRHIEAVNAEYRELETYSYELEQENAQLCDEIEMLREENESLKRGETPARRGLLSPPRSSPSNSSRSSTQRGSAPSLAPPSIDVPEIEVPDAGSSTPAPTLPPAMTPNRASPPANLSPTPPRSPATPFIPFRSGSNSSNSSGTPSSSVSSQKPQNNTLPLLPSAPKAPRHILEDPPPDPENTTVDQPAADQPSSELPPPAATPSQVEPEPVDGKVTHLFLNPILTRGVNLDQNPGDDGLTLVLEPRNQAGQFVPHAGPVSIVVLDPTKSGDAARIARWNFDEQLASQRINRQRDQRGIHLQLPWPGGAPSTDQVKLFVRYETADGRKVEAQHDVVLNPTSTASQRWTPRPGQRSQPVTPSPSMVRNSPAPVRAPVDLSTANPPLPKPTVQSDLTVVTPPAGANPQPKPTAMPQPGVPQQVIQEPGAQQPSVASKDTGAEAAPSLLAPPPARSGSPAPFTPAPSNRPEWKPFR